MSPLQLISCNPDSALTGSMDKRLGIIAVKLACWAPDLRSALLAPAPEIEVAGLVEWQPRTFARNKAGEQGGYDVQVTLEGHLVPEDANEEYYELEGSTKDEPIESHWNFDVILGTYGGGKQPDKSTGKMVWPRAVTTSSGATGRNRMYGVESWSAPGLVYTRNWVSQGLPDSIVLELGTIFQTLPGNPVKINLNHNRDWLCVRIRGRQRGNIWQLASSYELSGPDGSVPEIYPR